MLQEGSWCTFHDCSREISNQPTHELAYFCHLICPQHVHPCTPQSVESVSSTPRASLSFASPKSAKGRRNPLRLAKPRAQRRPRGHGAAHSWPRRGVCPAAPQSSLNTSRWYQTSSLIELDVFSMVKPTCLINQRSTGIQSNRTSGMVSRQTM